MDTDTIPQRDDQGPPRSARIGLVVVLAIAGALILAIATWALANSLGGSEAWDVEPGMEVVVVIEPGATAGSIYRQLEEARVARARDLERAATELGVESRLRAGTYPLNTSMDPDDVIRLLVAGPDASAGGRLVVVEGWTVERIVEEVAASLGVTQAEVQRVLRSGDLSSPHVPPVGGPIDELTRWEGILAAATYPVGPETTATGLLAAMVAEGTRRIDAIDTSRLGALGVDRYGILTIASLVEREAGTEDERDEIASVIHNRLDRGMRLQIDATVIYALGYNPGRLTASHLDVDSPWNTYRNDGLPPTPIGAPSVASIVAAADPATTDYLFYVLGSEDGSHLFAETYEGHQRNIEAARRAGVLP